MSKPLLGEYRDFLDISMEINNDIQRISLGVRFDLIFEVLDIIHCDIQKLC